MIICDIHYTDKMADFATFSSVVSQTVPLFVSYNPVLTCTIILKIWLVKVENASYKMCIIILDYIELDISTGSALQQNKTL